MKFNKITGRINYVPIETYHSLINEYVEKVKKIKGVISIVQIGSFTAPGLSDIDIIVIVDDKNPPDWEDISIKKILNDKPGSEVVAHEIFVYPQSLAKYIEGLFYLDRKNTLYGENIGNVFTDKQIRNLKLFLTFEYTIQKFETLLSLIYLPIANIRDIMLFYSTLRHTYQLLYDFNIISEKEKSEKILQIEKLRKKSINNNDPKFKNELNELIIPGIIALYESAIKISSLIYQSNDLHVKKKWILNCKKLIYSTNHVEKAINYLQKKDGFNRFNKAKIFTFPLPDYVFQHVHRYKKIDFKKNNINQLMLSNDVYKIRYYLAQKHKDFLLENRYPAVASYIIVDNKKARIQDILKKAFLTIYAMVG